jgi:hypothetical protein
MTARKVQNTLEQREAQRDAAYERGWVDSLSAYDRTSMQPTTDIYYYRQGWDACADYRWADPSNRGRALDLNYRKPRP